MGMREKLMELVATAPGQASYEIYSYVEIADSLIANGVTIPVRCKDCKYRRGDFFGGFVCRLHKGLAMVTDESFCSYGERRTDD